MNGKSIPSELRRSSSFASRLFSPALKRRLKICLFWFGLILLFFVGVFIEFQTSALQSWFFTSTNRRVFYKLAQGASHEISFPRPGPFDERKGYSKLPVFQTRLTSEGYQIIEQARQSETMLTLLEHGVSPPYAERPDTGLEIRGVDGSALFRYGQSEFLFGKIDTIPPLIVKSLLFLENRDLDRPATRWQNPVIEWDRIFKAALMYFGSKLHFPVPVQGGSTLAVQLEKFRHSHKSRTERPLEKLRQIMGASLKAY